MYRCFVAVWVFFGSDGGLIVWVSVGGGLVVLSLVLCLWWWSGGAVSGGLSVVLSAGQEIRKITEHEKDVPLNDTSPFAYLHYKILFLFTPLSIS